MAAFPVLGRKSSVKELFWPTSPDQARVGKLPKPVEVYDEREEDTLKLYRVRLQVLNPNRERGERNFNRILAQLTKAATSEGWEVKAQVAGPVTVGGEGGGDTSSDVILADLIRPPRPPFQAPELTNEALAERFAGVYDRDQHVRLIHDSVVNYAESKRAWAQDPDTEIARGHTLLKGKPAGCKTTLFERLKKFYDASPGGVERVHFIDMHLATKAGLENYLLDRAEGGELPDILVLEELEKVQPLDNLLPLVSLMGSGYLAKLNAWVGRRRELANVLVWATCNDENIVRRWRNGALWSRFALHLHCVRPNRELMCRILLDTVERRKGNPAWVEKALEFAYDIMPEAVGYPMDDPRQVKGLLDGRDRLLDGSYQRDLLAVLKAEAEEAEADRGR